MIAPGARAAHRFDVGVVDVEAAERVDAVDVDRGDLDEVDGVPIVAADEREHADVAHAGHALDARAIRERQTGPNVDAALRAHADRARHRRERVVEGRR